MLNEHRRYLADVNRLTAFQSAIDAVVRPGDVVVDLGSGTGVLGVLACRAGAARVYSLESTALIGLAREIARANGFDDRITFIKEHSERTHLPELADVVVADQIGGFGFEAGLLEYFADARRRLMKPGGVTIPRRLDLFASPVEAPELRRQVDFWDGSPFAVDVHPAGRLARNSVYAARYSDEDVLGEPAAVASLDPSVPDGGRIASEVRIAIERDGIVHGIGGWFRAELAEGIEITNSPLSTGSIDRHQAFLPIERAVSVEPGDHVDLAIRIVSSEVLVHWVVKIVGAGGEVKAESRHSTFQGMVVCEEDLRRQRPDFAPALSNRGEARRTVLALCNGKTPVGELEATVHQRYSELFPRQSDAAAFVADIVTHNA